MQDVQAGLSRKEALKGLVERTKVEELRHFVLAVIQADNFGVPGPGAAGPGLRA